MKSIEKALEKISRRMDKSNVLMTKLDTTLKKLIVSMLVVNIVNIVTLLVIMYLLL